MSFDFTTIADALDAGFGTSFRPDYTVMAGAQLHVKTAPCIIDGLTRLVQTGLYGWTSSNEPQYLDAIVNWMDQVRNWKIQREWIVPSYGILQALCASIRAFTLPGDGVIVQQPAYVLYSPAIQNCGRTLVNNPLILENGIYRMDFADLEEKMARPENKLMVLCNPHNPTLDVWDRDSLTEVARLAAKHGVIVVSDEIYAELTFGGAEAVPYAQIDGASDHCIICTSLGKAFNFTGTSHSNIIIPNEALREAYIKQRNADHYGSLSPFMRAAVLSAYTPEGKAWLDALVAFSQENIDYLTEFFRTHFPSVSICRHRAGTLVWADFRGWGLSEEELSQVFLAAGVEPDLGSKYGPEGTGFLRLQIGMPRQELAGALDRLAAEAKRRNLA